MKVLIKGSSGLIGSALVKSSSSNAHDVISLLRKNIVNDFPVRCPKNGVIELADGLEINTFIRTSSR